MLFGKNLLNSTEAGDFVVHEKKFKPAWKSKLTKYTCVYLFIKGIVDLSSLRPCDWFIPLVEGNLEILSVMRK